MKQSRLELDWLEGRGDGIKGGELYHKPAALPRLISILENSRSNYRGSLEGLTHWLQTYIWKTVFTELPSGERVWAGGRERKWQTGAGHVVTRICKQVIWLNCVRKERRIEPGHQSTWTCVLMLWSLENSSLLETWKLKLLTEKPFFPSKGVELESLSWVLLRRPSYHLECSGSRGGLPLSPLNLPSNYIRAVGLWNNLPFLSPCCFLTSKCPQHRLLTPVLYLLITKGRVLGQEGHILGKKKHGSGSLSGGTTPERTWRKKSPLLSMAGWGYLEPSIPGIYLI